jgi:hypothetical protein
VCDLRPRSLAGRGGTRTLEVHHMFTGYDTNYNGFVSRAHMARTTLRSGTEIVTCKTRVWFSCTPA